MTLILFFFSDCVHLQLYKDLKERQKNGQTKASLSLQQFLGFESGFTLDKESNTLAILCEDVVPVLAFDTREILIQWRVKVRSTNHIQPVFRNRNYISIFAHFIELCRHIIIVQFNRMIKILLSNFEKEIGKYGCMEKVLELFPVKGYLYIVPVSPFQVQHNLGSSKEFAAVIISAPSSTGIKAGPVRLHACGPRLALCASRPPEVLALWDVKLLRQVLLRKNESTLSIII